MLSCSRLALFSLWCWSLFVFWCSWPSRHEQSYFSVDNRRAAHRRRAARTGEFMTEKTFTPGELKVMAETGIASVEDVKQLALKVAETEAQVKQLAAERDAVVAENVALKSSRAILAENALETCNEVYTAGFRNTALHDGLMESTGNRNKYPNPIRTLVDEAKRNMETPATDAILASLRAEGVEMLAEGYEAAAKESDDFKFINHCNIKADQARDFAAQLRSKSEVQHD